MSVELEAADLARREVLTPALSTTKEVLAVHAPVQADGLPLIARADTTREPGAFYFYFRLQNEPYYVVIVVRPGETGLAVVGAYVEAAVRVFLLITSETLSPDEITRRVGLKPTGTHGKGKCLHKHLRPLAKTMWRFEPHMSLPESVDRKLALLLDELDGAAPRIAELAGECDVAVTICYEGYKDWLGGWVAGAGTLERLAALGANVELDLYASGPDLPEPK
jgi:hypothetical protein